MARKTSHTGPKVGLLLTAAGLSTRMGGESKKEYRLIDGRAVITHALSAFLEVTEFEEIVLTVPGGHEDQVHRLLSEQLPESSIPWNTLRIITGGETRQESVFRGLQAFSKSIEYCLIHDGARPWVSKALIRGLLRDCIAAEATIPVIPVTDAVKRIDMDGNISEHLGRNRTMGAQTPQAFAYPAILEAHRRAADDEETYIDDSEIYTRYAGPVHTISGEPENIKITFPRDLDPGK